jgi:hypothetical protein
MSTVSHLFSWCGMSETSHSLQLQVAERLRNLPAELGREGEGEGTMSGTNP